MNEQSIYLCFLLFDMSRGGETGIHCIARRPGLSHMLKGDAAEYAVVKGGAAQSMNGVFIYLLCWTCALEAKPALI